MIRERHSNFLSSKFLNNTDLRKCSLPLN